MSGPQLAAATVQQIREGLLQWFRVARRDLPWRRTRDPYAILVSEVMLQQTQVDRVIPYYTAFLERFPTAEALAAAPVAEVIRLWSGLGYNRRAVNLQRAAQAVAAEYGGQFPSDPAQLRKLPGLGPYTAGAVAAFAFERDVVFLDTNMRRVVTRLIFGVGDAAERDVLVAAQALLPPGHGWEWNQALIEFGALQCTARKPACVVCPLSGQCAAFPYIQGALAAPKPRAQPAEKFETSSRYYRGRIVEALRALPEGPSSSIRLGDLGPQLRDEFDEADLPWLAGLVTGLQRDGLATLAEERPAYDAPREITLETRVSLP
ncbi:MAG: A/G-specific adenine glycosylase [Thermomicrobiales bacterium]|nr:A/G-specific adenine glycosylase [Thermomicrobiales bacterium]